MISFPECVPCLLKQMLFVLDSQNISREEKERLFKENLDFISGNFPDKVPMELATNMHRNLRKSLNADPYIQIKDLSNKIMKEKDTKIQSYYEKYKNDLSKILKLVITGNIIDIKSEDEVDRLNIDEIVGEIMKKDLSVNHIDILKEKLDYSNNVLYLADNVGETFFDKALLKYLKQVGKKVTYAVRGDVILNDATVDDVYFAGIHDIVDKIITNGYDAPGTVLKYTGEEFNSEYKDADIIIAKGQGNFESLIGEKDERVFFLFLSKCKAISDFLNTSKNDIILANLNKLRVEKNL